MIMRALPVSRAAETVRMAPRVRRGPRNGTRKRADSSDVRAALAEAYGVVHPRTAAALYGECCHRVAIGNGVLRDFGQEALMMTHMAEIDASLGPRRPLDLMDALHQAEMADCFEQIPDETLREKLRRGEATVQDAEAYVAKSALARYKAEQAEAAVKIWIDQRKGNTP